MANIGKTLWEFRRNLVDTKKPAGEDEMEEHEEDEEEWEHGSEYEYESYSVIERYGGRIRKIGGR
jgi:hypothetical protein